MRGESVLSRTGLGGGLASRVGCGDHSAGPGSRVGEATHAPTGDSAREEGGGLSAPSSRHVVTVDGVRVYGGPAWRAIEVFNEAQQQFPGAHISIEPDPT